MSLISVDLRGGDVYFLSSFFPLSSKAGAEYVQGVYPFGT